jgi:acid phosphatase type 7
VVRFTATAVVALAGIAGAAAPAHAGPRKGPYLQNVTPVGITVMWQSERAAPGQIVVEGPGLPPGGKTVEVASTRIAETPIDGLRPASRYRYRVELGGESYPGEFATAPEVGSGAPFSFVVFGDTRSNAENHRRVMDRAASEVPDFLLGTGDLVDRGDREDQWQTFFDVERRVLRDNVIFPALGNHDRQGRGRTADNFRTYFSVPENSPDPGRYYAFSYGNARFLVLDSNSTSFALTDQTAWIESQLAEARQDARVDHVFVVMHHPPFSISLHGGQRDLRERWTPLFEKYAVTAVFSGHDHCYERAEDDGVHYFVSGGGGAPLYPRAPRPSPIDKAAVQRFERVLHYLRVSIHGKQVDVAAIRADGTAIETTTWGDAPRPLATAPVAGLAGGAGGGFGPRSGAGGRAAAISVAPAAAAPGSEGGIGWLGLAGVAAALLAATVFARALRR